MTRAIPNAEASMSFYWEESQNMSEPPKWVVSENGRMAGSSYRDRPDEGKRCRNFSSLTNAISFF